MISPLSYLIILIKHWLPLLQYDHPTLVLYELGLGNSEMNNLNQSHLLRLHGALSLCNKILRHINKSSCQNHIRIK